MATKPSQTLLTGASPRRLGLAFLIYAACLVLLVSGFLVFAHETEEAAAAAMVTAGLGILWLVPYHVLPLTLDALGWRSLLRLDPHSDSVLTASYLVWVASVREAVGSILPIVRIGGEVVGVHLIRRRGIRTAFAAASVVVEVTVTLVSQIVLACVGLLLLDMIIGHGTYLPEAIPFAIAALGVVALFILLQHGGLIGYVGRLFRHFSGLKSVTHEDGSSIEGVDHALRAIYRHGRALAYCFLGQTAGLLAGAGEVWIAMRLMNHPVSPVISIVIEAMVQALRTGGFFVPSALGVQEVGLVFLGGLIGLPGDLMLAVSILKRIREIIYGGIALLSWQWVESRRVFARRHTSAVESP